MSDLRLVRLVAQALILGALVAGGMVLTPAPLLVFGSEQGPARGAAHGRESSAALDSLISASASEAPFRASRTPATRRYDPLNNDPALPTEPPAPPKPLLRLSGIVWGERPSAVIEGLPGASGPRVVRSGDVVGELRVRRVAREQVIVAGLDTLWVLLVEEPWR